jgi:hypothetical protein
MLPHTIMVAAATYIENLTIPESLNLTIVGSSVTNTKATTRRTFGVATWEPMNFGAD